MFKDELSVAACKRAPRKPGDSPVPPELQTGIRQHLFRALAKVNRDPVPSAVSQEHLQTSGSEVDMSFMDAISSENGDTTAEVQTRTQGSS